MRCPQCNTENRDDRAACYHCEQDLTMLRVVVNRAKNHYNAGLEHADRDRNDEAIAELKHAVELDASFTNAWVVLGTIYAKKEMFDEAKEAWRKALSLDPRLEKTHNYLMKAESVSGSLPVIGRLRALAVVLFIALVAMGVALAASMRPDRAAAKIQSALDLADEKKIGESIAAFGEASNLLLASAKTKRVATFLQAQLQDKLRAQVEQAAVLAETKDYRKALDAIAVVEAEHPPQEVVDSLAALKSEVGDRIASAAQEDLRRFHSGDLAYDALAVRLADLQAIAGETPAHEKIAAMATEAKKEYEERGAAAALNQVRTATTLADASALAADASRKFPSVAQEFDGIVTGRLDALARKNQRDLEVELLKGNITRARELVNATKTLYDEVHRTPPAELLQSMNDSISLVERAGRLDEVKDAYQKKDWDKVASLTKDVHKLSNDPKEVQQLDVRRKEALQNIATDLWNWASEDKMDQKIWDLRITSEEALRINQNYNIVLENLPNKTSYKTRTMRVYAAAAALRLDRKSDANELLNQALENNPSAKFKAQVERFRKQHAAGLKQ